MVPGIGHACRIVPDSKVLVPIFLSGRRNIEAGPEIQKCLFKKFVPGKIRLKNDDHKLSDIIAGIFVAMAAVLILLYFL